MIRLEITRGMFCFLHIRIIHTSISIEMYWDNTQEPFMTAHE